MTDVLVEPDAVAARIRSYLRDHPELRKDEYDGREDTVDGLCYVAAEAYFHAKGGLDSGLTIYCLSWSNVDPSYNGTHWYLRDDTAEVWIDVGLEDAGDAADIPFGMGTRRAFITGYEPSQRTMQVLDAIDLASKVVA
jgi:hypothetical protein